MKEKKIAGDFFKSAVRARMAGVGVRRVPGDRNRKRAASARSSRRAAASHGRAVRVAGSCERVQDKSPAHPTTVCNMHLSRPWRSTDGAALSWQRPRLLESSLACGASPFSAARSEKGGKRKKNRLLSGRPLQLWISVANRLTRSDGPRSCAKAWFAMLCAKRIKALARGSAAAKEANTVA